MALGTVAVLDSKNPQGAVLEVSRSAWSAFVEGAKGL